MKRRAKSQKSAQPVSQEQSCLRLADGIDQEVHTLRVIAALLRTYCQLALEQQSVLIELSYQEAAALDASLCSVIDRLEELTK